MSFYVDGSVLLDRMDLVLKVVMADSMGTGGREPKMCPEARGRSGHLAQAKPTRSCGSQRVGIFFSRSRKEGDRQQARGASLRNSHIFPAASVVTGGPAQDARPPTFSYLPALTTLCRERRGSSLRRPCSRDHGAAWRARSGGGYPSRVLWGHHPGRRADCRLSVSVSAGPNSFSLLLKIEKKRGIGMGRGDVYCLGRSRSSSSGRVRTGSALGAFFQPEALVRPCR